MAANIAAIIAMAGKLYGADKSIYKSAKRVAGNLGRFYNKRQKEEEKLANAQAKTQLQNKIKQEKLQTALLKQKEAQQKTNAKNFQKALKQDSAGVMRQLFPHSRELNPVNPQPLRKNDLKIPKQEIRNRINAQKAQLKQNTQKLKSDFGSGKMFPSKNSNWNQKLGPKPISEKRFAETNPLAKGLNKTMAKQEKAQKKGLSNPVSMESKIKNVMDGNA